MKPRRKNHCCLNCDNSLPTFYNYCPSCGQENTDSKISFKEMMGEFITNFFAIDSRFGRTLKPFFIKPGELTVQFMKGKRRTYAHPVRMYLIFSLFFFAVFTGFITDSINQLKTDHFQRLENGADDSSMITKQKLSEEENYIENSETFEKDEIPDDSFLFSKIDMAKLDSLANSDRFTDAQVIDSVTIKPLTDFERYIGIQVVRIKRAGDEVVISYVLQNLSIMMLLLIPIFALLLKLFYIRTDHFYITHFVHGLYLHSFVYFIFGIFIFLSRIFFNDIILFFPLLISFAILTIYAFISFLRIYQQSWLKTLLKYLIIGIIYINLLGALFLIEMLISILLY